MICDNCRAHIGETRPKSSAQDTLLQTARVQNLLNSNEPPSDAEAAMMQETLSQHRQSLKDLDKQILQAEKVLSSLKTTREQVADEATKYDAILHPVRRLPEDVLSEIFLASICTNFMDASDFATVDCERTLALVSQTCRKWRDVSISCSRLWSYIAISLDYPSTEGALLSLGLKLQRSRSCPLTIWLEWGQKPSPGHTLLLTLLPSSVRWETLILAGGDQPCPPSLLAPIRGFLPLLQVLHIQAGPLANSDLPISWFEFAPSLNNLVTVSDPLSFLLPSSQVADWMTTPQCQLSNPIDFLSKAINIERVEIHLSSNNHPTTTPCTLQRLASLRLSRNSETDEPDASRFLDRLTLPALQELELFAHLQKPSSLPSLIERSNASLQKLALGSRIIVLDSQTLTRVLEASPQIREMAFAARKSFTDSMVDKLVFKPHGTPLAPCLEKITLCGTLPCSNRALIEMIASRCASASQSSLSLVKFNKISFAPEGLAVLQDCVRRGLELWNGAERI